MTKIGNTLFPQPPFIGFDHLFNELEHATKHAYDHYPPHNIIREDETNYVIELAVAGFTKGEIDVEQKERSLIVSGEHQSRERDVIHRGISTKKFKRTFRLSEYVLVDGATLKDGILAIKLKLELPEEKRPRKVNIK